MKLQRPIGLVLGCALSREAAVQAAFVDFFLKTLHFIMARNCDLSMPIEMVQIFWKIQ